MKKETRLEDLGEDAVIREITRSIASGPDVRVGIGDDCAVVGAPRAPKWTLLKTDAVIEGIHFDSRLEPERVGWKALCRAISDIAAMGGTPQHALVTLAISPRAALAWVKNLYRGLRKAAKRHEVRIVGGETSRSPGPTFISIALTGTVARNECILRSGGSAGDLLYVTGTLGGSLAGKHLDFTPRLSEARLLAQHIHPTAMMDISDGLAADLPRLANASGCSFFVDLDRVPRNPGTSLGQALADGEDFELLFAVPERKADGLEERWRRTFRKVELTRIGQLLPRGRRSTDLHAHGYDHFA
jgi:thiamine-monophosphate kinase